MGRSASSQSATVRIDSALAIASSRNRSNASSGVRCSVDMMTPAAWGDDRLVPQRLDEPVDDVERVGIAERC